MFGCGGDRDRGKRPIMGEIAVKGADVVIVTDDNPRWEIPPRSARKSSRPLPAPLKSASAPRRSPAPSRCWRRGDALVIAGKGHETGQMIGASVLPFSDHEAARAALQSLSEAG